MTQNKDKWQELLQQDITDSEAVGTILSHAKRYITWIMQEKGDIAEEWIATTLQRDMLAFLLEKSHPELSEAIDSLRYKDFTEILDTFASIEDIDKYLNEFINHRYNKHK